VGDVLEVLNQQDQEDAAIILAQEEERQQLEMLRKKVGVLAYDGYMEKKSPAHNLWQVSDAGVYLLLHRLPITFYQLWGAVVCTWWTPMPFLPISWY
jgi:hypothetical protein